jgi:hypothetical protein
VGDVTLKNGEPNIHAHVVLAQVRQLGILESYFRCFASRVFRVRRMLEKAVMQACSGEEPLARALVCR